MINKKIVNNILAYAREEEVDRLIIASGKNKVFINYYTAEDETHSFSLPKKLEADLIADLHQIMKVGANELVNNKYAKIHNKDLSLNFYLSVLTNKFGEKIIINIIKKEHKLWRIKQLGLQLKQLKLLQKIIRTKSGLIIISSPSDEGKSTTLYSILNELNKTKLDVYLLEENPEHEIAGVNQLAPSITNWNLLLRHDSDVIALDDCDDDDTFMRAVQAAVSGRLVIISMLANSSWEVLLKLLRLKLPLELKLNSLKLIINQRVAKLQRAKSKPKVSRQKIGLFETLEFSSAMREFILATRHERQKKQFWEKIAQIAISNGFLPLADDLKNKLDNKLIDPENYL